ncbi:hypothetical protein [Luedemannella helvata]|uniref:KfrA N-terminal DNA-binding domain-containing protein n=1 Tax=Luedemannella helvata TaxID=349315 RepID=A0ABN2KDH4_9ACTN
MADIAENVLRELYAGPPERFVAGRDAAVAAARAAGDRGLATAVGKLRKPTVGAWLVNLLAWHAPDELAALYAVADELRAAQRDLRGDDLRQLSARRRAVVADLVTRSRQLVAEARPGGDAPLPWDEVTATLNAVLSDVETAELVRAGRLVRTTSYAGFGEPDDAWVFSAAEAAAAAPQRAGRGDERPRPPARVKAEGAARVKAEGAARDKADSAARDKADSAARDKAERERHRAAAAELRAAGDEEERARADYDAAAGAEDRARQRLDELERDLADLRERKIAAQEELNRLRARRQAAQRALTTATRRLRRARDRAPD